MRTTTVQTQEEHVVARQKTDATKALFESIGRGRADYHEWEVDDRPCSHAPKGKVIGITRRVRLSESFADGKLSIEAMHCVYFDNSEAWHVAWSATGMIMRSDGRGPVPGEQELKIIERAKAIGVEMPRVFVKCESADVALQVYLMFAGIFEQIAGIDVSDIKNPWVCDVGPDPKIRLSEITGYPYYLRFRSGLGISTTPDKFRADGKS